MKTNKLFIVSVLAVALLGCGKHEPRHIVILPDVSGSIDRESLQQAFKAIDELAGHLQRGDRLTIIPISGDAEAEASGRILRFEVPANRQAYDTDLRDFRIQLSSSLNKLEANAVLHPGAKTDIWGAVALAAQEFQADAKPQKILLILSDFIQEDRETDFSSDPHLNNTDSVERFATRQIKAQNIKLNHIKAYLGLLRSREFTGLNQSRRNAIKKFWIQYFKNSGAHPTFSADGLGLLIYFLEH